MLFSKILFGYLVSLVLKKEGICILMIKNNQKHKNLNIKFNHLIFIYICIAIF